MGKLFGTDGVRGIANKELTPDLAYKLGYAGAIILTGDTSHKPKVLIGCDTRISCAMLEAALTAGICSAGADVYLCGVIPTPAVAYLTKKYKCDAGVMISASHNSYEYNGIKFFSGTGFKLPDDTENKIETIVEEYDENNRVRPIGGQIGQRIMKDAAAHEYASREDSVWILRI
jgi:phosphoglucosamine mutase